MDAMKDFSAEYKELEGVLAKILSDENYPKVESNNPFDSTEANNLFMRGYMTGFSELYSTMKRMRRLLNQAVSDIQEVGCRHHCIKCAKDGGNSRCDGVFEWKYKSAVEQVLSVMGE